jgi:hypothetical protein
MFVEQSKLPLTTSVIESCARDECGSRVEGEYRDHVDPCEHLVIARSTPSLSARGRIPNVVA